VIVATRGEDYEEMATFYEDHLVADGWQRVYPDRRPNDGLFFERRPGFYLSIETEIKTRLFGCLAVSWYTSDNISIGLTK
jgi:hypothetical protein